jgi:hypothetical protein
MWPLAARLAPAQRMKWPGLGMVKRARKGSPWMSAAAAAWQEAQLPGVARNAAWVEMLASSRC